ncbi:MAG: hypothetical protein Q8P24_02825 [Desulfobacterales bacterium]|nr:hypothetical protein [Desulfobacterales bacterium]
MFEEVLPENAISVVESLGTRLEEFYLSGGTGFALQLGHRKSNDFVFFSPKPFKKDFIDLYAADKMKYTIADICGFFKQRFKAFDLNVYHVLKSLVFFEDAEKEPSPEMLLSGQEWKWDTIKSFFIVNLELFEKELTQEI